MCRDARRPWLDTIVITVKAVAHWLGLFNGRVLALRTILLATSLFLCAIKAVAQTPSPTPHP